MSRPSFQFYPDDWMNDLALRGCSPLSRAIWIDMMCLMHQGIPYGHLADAAGALTVKVIANRCHTTTKELGKAVLELETRKVFSRTPEGVIYSRRMVRDEHNRNVRASGGPKSLRNPSVPRPKDTFKDVPPNGHKGPTHENEVEVRKILEPVKQPSQSFLKWWTLWSKTRGTNHRMQAENAFTLWVSEEDEEACFECTKSYLESLEKPSSGYNPETFLMEQSQDRFSARWPKRGSIIVKSRQQQGADDWRQA